MTTRFGDGYLQGTNIRQGRETADANARAGEAAARRDERNYKADRDDARDLAEHRQEQNRIRLLELQNQGSGGASPEEIEKIRQDNELMSEELQGLKAEKANEHVTFALEGFIQTGDFGYMERGFKNPGVKEALEEIGVSDMMPVDWENDGELLSSVGFSYAAMQNKKFRDAASREYFKYKKDGEWAISSVESTAMQFGVFKNFTKATNDQHTAGVAAIHAAFNGVDLEHDKKTKDDAAALASRTQDDVKAKNDQDNENTDDALRENAHQFDETDKNTDAAAAALAAQAKIDDDNADEDRKVAAQNADANLLTAKAAYMNAETTAGKPKVNPTERERNSKTSDLAKNEAYATIGAKNTAEFFAKNLDKSTEEGKANFNKVWPNLQRAEFLIGKAPNAATQKVIAGVDVMADLGSKAIGIKDSQAGWIDSIYRNIESKTWASSPEGKRAIVAYEAFRNRSRVILFGTTVPSGEIGFSEAELSSLTAQPATIYVQIKNALESELSAISSLVNSGHPQAMHARMATTKASLEASIRYLDDRIAAVYPDSVNPNDKDDKSPPLDQGQIDAMNAAGKRQPNARGPK